MGGGASSESAFEQMLACTMILGEAMVNGLDPRFVRFPDMYRLYDFHVGPKKQQSSNPFEGGQMVLLVRNGGSDGTPQLVSANSSTSAIVSKKGNDDEDEEGIKESNDSFLVVYISGDKIVLDRATLNQPNNDGWTSLHACCHTLNAQEAGITILKELIASKADLNGVTKRGPGSFSCGWTALHIATAYGLEALALRLIRAHANVNSTNSVGWTPLYDACHRGYASVARELLQAGAKHDVICPEFALCPYPGQYPLAEAARQGHLECVKLMLEWSGVDKNAANKLGWTALHEAAYHNRVDVVKLLIVYGADVLVRTVKGSLARDVTISNEIRSILEDLSQDAPASPKKQAAVVPTEDAKPTVSPVKRSPSPTKAQQQLSRKEEYAMLGDLPSLDAPRSRPHPSISIKAVDDEDDEGDDDEGKAAEEEEEEPTKPKRKVKKHCKKHEKDVPAAFKCAVSLKLLKEPMRSPLGHVFEHNVIEAWFHDFGNRCPLTGQPLVMSQLELDEKLKAEIREWKHGSRKPKTAPEEEMESQGMVRKPVKTQEDAKTLSSVDQGVEIDPYDF